MPARINRGKACGDQPPILREMEPSEEKGREMEKAPWTLDPDFERLLEQERGKEAPYRRKACQ